LYSPAGQAGIADYQSAIRNLQSAIKMIRLLAISRNTFVEAIRQPVYGVLILVTFAVLVLDLPLSTYSMGTGVADYQDTDQKMMVNLGLSTLLVSGLLLAAFSASGVLSREIEDKTILTVVSKPVSRPTVVLGKFVGVAAAIAIAYYLCSLVFLMTVRHKVMPSAADPYDFPVIILGCSAFVLAIAAALFCNYFFGWNFASAAVGFGTILLSLAMGTIAFVGKGWKIVPFGQDISPDILMAMLLMLFAVLVFVALAVASSTRLGQVMTLLVCFAFFFLGSTSQYFFGRFAAESYAAKATYLLFPNLTFFYVMDALVAGKPIPVSYVGVSAAYAACQVVAILAIGMALFQRRELTGQTGSSSSAAPLPVSLLAWTGRGGAIGVGIFALSRPGGFGSIIAVITAIGLVAAAIAGWVVAGWFGRGVKWTYYFAIVCAGLTVALVAAAGFRSSDNISTPVLAGVVAAGIVALILLLPRTRHHFSILRKSKLVISN
jgi:ABC-type transport system involved in multi-copper enzyme maturation permease subunit